MVFVGELSVQELIGVTDELVGSVIGSARDLLVL